MGEPNFRDELEEVWVPKDAGELEGLLLTIQNEPGKKILKHKIQQVIKEKRHNNRGDSTWQDWVRDGDDDYRHDNWENWSGDSWSEVWPDNVGY